MKTLINATVIAAALASKGYPNTADGFRSYADDNYNTDTPLNAVVKSLDVDWNGDFGAITVEAVNRSDDTLHNEVFQLISGKDGDIPAGEFLNDAPQVG